MVIGQTTLYLIYAILRYALSAAVAAISVFAGLKAFDRLTSGLDEMKEIKKGNSAVALYFVSIAISISILVMPTIAGFAADINPAYPSTLLVALLAIDIVKIAIMLCVSLLTLYAIFAFIGNLAVGISEVKELKAGNMAVAILIAGVLISVSLVIQAGVGGLFASGPLSSCQIVQDLVKIGLNINADACASASQTIQLVLSGA